MLPYTRTREIGLANYQYEWFTSYTQAGGGTVGPLYSYTFRDFQRMSDDLHVYRKGTHRYPPGRCLHTKISNRSTNFVAFANDNGGTETPVGFQVPILHEHVEQHIPAFPDSLRSQLAEEAFNTFSDRFPQQISFTEFVGGLGELKGLIPQIASNFTQTASGLLLNKKFGWDNLISDLRALSRLCKGMEARLRWLAKTYGIPTRLSYYRGNCFQPVVEDLYHDELPPFGYGYRLVVEHFRYDFRAGCWLLQKLDHLNDVQGFIRELTGALGLNNPLKAAWVVLPGSFIVDWLFKVSTHLDRLARIVPGEQWDVNDVTYSIKCHFHFKLLQDNTHRNASDPLLLRGYVDFDEYRRDVGFPIGLDVFTISDLSPSQLTLLLALIGVHT